MKKIITILFISTFYLFVYSCGDKANDTPPWEWDDPDKPDEKTDKPRYLWIDAAANFPEYANSKENIKRDLQLAKETGFTDIVVDVRPSMGDVLYKTDLVQQVKKLDVWEGSLYKYYERTATWDYLQEFIDQGHALGLKVHAGFNTFVGGNEYPYGLGSQGLLFRDANKKDWATSLNLKTGVKNVMDVSDNTYGTKFFNPSNDNVQAFILSLLEDLAKYNVDGIFLDRCRFNDMNSDFSAITRAKFEDYIGEKVVNFPSDIMVPETSSIPSTLPKYFKKWLEFRVKIIHDFVEKAHTKVKSVNSKIQFGVYVGGWYSTYYEVGVNWASPKFNTSEKYPNWASAEYKNFGYADHLDFLLLGAYASANRIYGEGEWTVQGFCKNAQQLLKDDVKFAGGPDVGNWYIPEGTNVNLAVTNSVDAAINASNGYFLFDMVHLRMYNYWGDVKKGIDSYLEKNK